MSTSATALLFNFLTNCMKAGFAADEIGNRTTTAAILSSSGWPGTSSYIKPDKEKSVEKIDGIVASIMALGRCARNGTGNGSVYDERGVISF